MTPQMQTPGITEAEYLAIERAAPFKSEFHDGAMFPMGGVTLTHRVIAANLICALGNRLAGRGCLTFTSDLRVKVEMTGLNTYPDVSVVCGEMRFADAEEDTLVNPTFVAEVLSDATESYDRGDKFEHCRRIPSLQAYLLATQRKPALELFLRGAEGQWTLHEAAGLEATLEIPPLHLTLPLQEVFANITFPQAATRWNPGAARK